jgi:hypothetical protein
LLSLVLFCLDPRLRAIALFLEKDLGFATGRTKPRKLLRCCWHRCFKSLYIVPEFGAELCPKVGDGVIRRRFEVA